ncbi:hypothetical protein Q1695_010457 [Nippostrongylus brasiliensis]|nr:hypothetical protein Q1695_010457 [Nippostrongylus brasiliensis]
MDTDVVKAFNAELTSVYDSKPPLSKKKIQDISKAALKAKGFYKHVVFSVEKFLAKCKTEYKIPCLYVIDSIIRTSKHQLKEKDVFAPRFLKNFSKTLSDLLSCPVADQPRVVRTLNLWGANGVYTEEQLAPFKQQCRDMGIDTDIERVERLVKGEDADMSRYGGAYGRQKEKEKKKKHRHGASESPSRGSQGNNHDSYQSTTPPMPPPSSTFLAPSAPVPVSSSVPFVPVSMAPAFPGAQKPGESVEDMNTEPSEEIPPCGLSERKLLDMMLDANFDFSGAFKSDIVLLRKAHGLICRALDARIRSVGDKPEIKDLLSSQFDYSDEEDDGEESKKPKRPNVTKVLQEDLLSIARNLIEDPNVIAAFKRMHAERIVALNQVTFPGIASQRQLSQIQGLGNAGGVPTSAAPSLQTLNMAKALSAGLPLSQGVPAPLPNLAGLQGLQNLPGLQGLAGLPSLNLAQLSALNQANAAQPNQALLNLLANNSLVSKLGSLSGLHLANARPPPVSLAGGIDPAQLAKQQEILQQLASGGASSTISGVPPPSGIGLLGAAPNQLLGSLAGGPVPMMTEDSGSEKDVRRKDRKRSRSRDGSDRKKRRSRSRDRKSDRVDRERRKLGLPAVQEGLTTVASKTLWFGRLPPNCSENDIRTAVESVGDVARVNVIGSRACAYATMSSRRAAFEVIQRLAKDLQIARRNVKVDWAKGTGMKDNELAQFWDGERGISLVPWNLLPANLERFCEGSYLDVESLPPEKRSMFTDAGTPITTPHTAAQSKTATDSPSSPPPTSMHASPIKSLVPDSPAVITPMPPQAVPPPSAFPPFMGIPSSPHGGNPFMAPPPPQMVPPPGFPMRLPLPPGVPTGMPPGMHGQMFGMNPGGAGGIMMPPPPGSMPAPSSMPPTAPPIPTGPPPTSSMPPPVPGVSGMPSGPMRPGPPMAAGAGPVGPPPPAFNPAARGGFGGGGFRGGRAGFGGGRGAGGFHGDRPFNARDNPNITLVKMDDGQPEREGRRPWNDRGDRGGHRGGWNENKDGRGREIDRDRRKSDDRGEKRRSRWGDSDDRGGSRWEGRDRHRNERDDRDREPRRDRDRDRDRERDRDRDRERDRDRDGDRRRDRDRSERGDRPRRDREERDRHRTRERDSPRYDDAPPSQSQAPEKVRNGSEEAMVTSTTDVEPNTGERSMNVVESAAQPERQQEKIFSAAQEEAIPERTLTVSPPTEA